MATRWGIASAGRISHDFTNSIVGVLPGEDHQVVAVAARKLEDAQKFAEKHGIGKAYGEYSGLATDPDIDVVYVGCIHPHHLALARLYLEAGKHVLCEKPLCMNVRETAELVQLARTKKLFLMEAIWSRCIPSYQALKQELAQATIGDVKQVLCTFGAVIEADRLHKKELGGGSILDLGVYTVQLAQLVYGGDQPAVTATGHLGQGDCDESASISLTYSEGRTATLVIHSRVNLPNEAVIIGTKGTLKLSAPMWTATELVYPDGSKKSFPLPQGSKHGFNFLNSANFAHEAEHVRQCIKGGRTESNLLSLDETLTIAKIMEEARQQIGVVYPQDN